LTITRSRRATHLTRAAHRSADRRLVLTTPRLLRDIGSALVVAALGLIIPPAQVQAQVSSPASARADTAARGDTLTLTLADVRRLTLRQNPAFLADRQESAIARGELRQARVYRFNPDLSVVAPRGSGTSTELTLMQEIEWAGQRGLRIDAARTGVTRASWSVRNAARLTLTDASVAFYRALAAQRRLAVTQEVFALNERLLRAVRVQLQEGEISALEANLAEIEFGRARGRVLAARRDATANLLELTRLLGVGPDVEVRLVADTTATPIAPVAVASSDMAPTPPALARRPADSTAGTGVTNLTAPPANAGFDLGIDQDSLIAIALARRPDVAAATASVEQHETLTSLARRETIPNLRVGAAAEREPGASSPGIGLALGVSLPFLNRNQGIVAQQRALTEQARLERQATELRVRSEVANALRAYRTASEEAAVFEQMVLRPARQNTELLEEAYRAGKIPLTTLLLLRNQLLDAELGYWDAWLAQREAVVQLDAATGALTPEDLATLTTDESPARMTR
jgi:cobalt-zinc-cadmium efflux system outer membrane protein